jgi:hypothetical protein
LINENYLGEKDTTAEIATPTKKKRDMKSERKDSPDHNGPWLPTEHNRFVQGVILYGIDYEKISENV